VVECTDMTLNELISLATLDGKRTGCAVYALEHIASGRRLVCKTTNLSKRLWDHRKYLARGRHHNAAVQVDLKRDGARAFRFVLLELVEEPKQLALLKRVYVEDARRRGLTYNPPEPTSRRSLSHEKQGSRTANVEATEKDGLEEALARLRQLSSLSSAHPAAAAAWLKLSEQPTANPDRPST
jgi:hypothetical protein